MAVKVTSIPETAAWYRQQLLQREESARRTMARKWFVVQQGIDADTRALLSAIQARGIASPNELYRLERYAAFMRQTEARIADYTAAAQADTADLVGWAALHGGEAAEDMLAGTAAGAGAALTKQSGKAVEQMVARVTVGHAAEAFRGIPLQMAGKVADVLVAAIGRGQHPTKTAREIRAITGQTLYQAQRIARTETMTAYRDSNIDAWSSSDTVQGWMWQSATDGRTCPVCWGMHGQWFLRSTPFETHVMCRCVPVPMTEGAYALSQKGWDMRTGDERFALLPEDEKRRILGPGRYEAYQQGIPLKDMVRRTSDPVWGGGRGLIPLRELPGYKPKPPVLKAPKPKAPKPKAPAAPKATTAPRMTTSPRRYAVDPDDVGHLPRVSAVQGGAADDDALRFLTRPLKGQADDVYHTRTGIGASLQARGDAKREIVDALADRLKGDKDFADIVSQVARWDRVQTYTDDVKQTVSALVRKWADTSGDGDPLACALQRAAAKEFGLKGYVTDHLSESTAGVSEAGLRRFLRVMYEHTQEEFDRLGFPDTVTLYRGVSTGPGMGLEPLRDGTRGGRAMVATVTSQPMSSWTVTAPTAEGFGDVMMVMEVPRSAIIGTSRTGFGCLNEAEYVVAGGKSQVVAKGMHALLSEDRTDAGIGQQVAKAIREATGQ